MRIEPILADIAKLDRAEQLELAHRLWQELFEHGSPLDLTDAERGLIDERLATHEAATDDPVPWNVVEAQVLAELRGQR